MDQLVNLSSDTKTPPITPVSNALSAGILNQVKM